MKILRMIMPAACDIYNMRLIEVDVNPNSKNEQYANYFACDCQNEGKFLKMIEEIKDVLRNKCANHFQSGHKYYYLTTSYASQIKNLKVRVDIHQNKSTFEYNYFDSESKAKQVLQTIIDIFARYGVALSNKKFCIY